MMLQETKKHLQKYFQHYDNKDIYFVNFLHEETTIDEPEDIILQNPKKYEELPRYTNIFPSTKYFQIQKIELE